MIKSVLFEIDQWHCIDHKYVHAISLFLMGNKEGQHLIRLFLIYIYNKAFINIHVQ